MAPIPEVSELTAEESAPIVAVVVGLDGLRTDVVVLW